MELTIRLRDTGKNPVIGFADLNTLPIVVGEVLEGNPNATLIVARARDVDSKDLAEAIAEVTDVKESVPA